MNIDATLEAELDSLMAKAGIKIPSERRAGVLASYADLRHLIDVLNSLSTDAEPSNVFRPAHPADRNHNR